MLILDFQYWLLVERLEIVYSYLLLAILYFGNNRLDSTIGTNEESIEFIRL